MMRIASSLIVILALVLAFFGGRAISAQDKYTVQVPDGLAFSEFRGYEGWPVIAISENGSKIAVIVGNPVQMLKPSGPACAVSVCDGGAAVSSA